MNEGNINESGMTTENINVDDVRTKIEANQFVSPSIVEHLVSLAGLRAYVEKNKDRINEDQSKSGHVLVLHDTESVTLRHGLYARPIENFRDQITVIVIKGQMKTDPDLEAIQTWNKRMYAPNDLSKLIRANKHLFAIPEEWLSLRTELQDFVAKVDEVRGTRHDDQGGSYKHRFERVLKDVPTLKAKLKVPLVYGMPAEEMTFEVAFDSSEEVVTAGLRNWDLETKIREAKELQIQNVTNTISGYLPETPIMSF